LILSLHFDLTQVNHPLKLNLIIAMSLITFNKVNFSFGSRIIFDRVSFQIQAGSKIGLIGSNGMGKTTLFKLITGELKEEKGNINRQNNLNIGYLPQEFNFQGNAPILDFVLASTGNRKELESQIFRVQNQLSQAQNQSDKEKFGEKLAELYEKKLLLEERFSSHKAESILHGLGFTTAQFSQPLDTFSGGWQMRVLLASLLFSTPDLLLMDEPTNHLDLPSLNWVDEYLDNYSGALLIISHDKEFLDRNVNRIFALENDGFREYKGNYSYSRELRKEEEIILENRKKNMERKQKHLEKFIERFKAQANKARQAKSKAKLLRKMEEVETIDREEKINFTLPEVERSGARTLHFKNLTKSFGNNVVFEDVSQLIQRGDKIALVGTNGSGKTTLLKTIAGELEADRGQVVAGANVTISYYAQHQADLLNLDNTILEEIKLTAPRLGETSIRTMLGAFLFKNDDVHKKIGVLSGGEKARVALARLLVAPGNLLLMDEPTNHLDLESTEILADALGNFAGTILFVSHNRSFINSISNKIWELEDSRIREFPGNLKDYLFHVKNNSPDEVDSVMTGDKTIQKADSDSEDNDRRLTKAERRRREAQYRKILKKYTGDIQKKIAKLENRIETLESENELLEKKIADPDFFGKPEYVDSLKQFEQNRSKLEELMGRWTFQNEKMEEKMEEVEEKRKEIMEQD
jgi:ATP-binding cassette subfamily F protein 3